MSQRWYATGRRKEAVARVWVKPGTGQLIINKRDHVQYFHRESNRMHFLAPLELTDLRNKVDILCNVTGGGHSGQAGAIRHGLSRALLHMNPDLRATLKKAGFLTRDARVVERKKVGKKKARKSEQYSKR